MTGIWKIQHFLGIFIFDVFPFTENTRSRSKVLIVELVANPVLYFLYKLRTVLTIHIDVLGGDDGDRMSAPGAPHLIHQNPLPSAGIVLQDIIVVVVVPIISIILSS